MSDRTERSTARRIRREREGSDETCATAGAGSSLVTPRGAVVCFALAIAGLLGYSSGCGGVDSDNTLRRSGSNGDGKAGSGPTESPSDPSLKPAAAHARRLSATEIRNSMRDLFAIDDSTFKWSAFPTEGVVGKQFDNDLGSLSAPSSFTSALQSAAEWAGQAAAAKLNTLLPCDTKNGDAACATQFIDTYGPRAYRRPISEGERADLVALYTTTRASADYPTSIATVIEAMLQSPNFLYRTELGNVAGAASVLLTPFEKAAALSYFLWKSIPDSSLFDAAANGKLETRADVEEQAKRMVTDPRAGVAVSDMFQQWLALSVALSKTDSAFNAKVDESMRAEMTTFVRQTVWSGPQGFRDLFTSSSSFIDANIAALYGVPTPTGSGMVSTALDPAKHGGILTMPGFIATHNDPTNRSPIKLGKVIRTSLLCQELMPPPNNVPQPPSDPNLDIHGRYEQHSSDPSCASCHRMMDPIGFGWSQYDVLGRFSPVDHGVTEDGVGHLTGTDVDGAFTGPVELGVKLASSAQVQKCFTETVLRWSLGRDVSHDATSSDSEAFRRATSSGFAAGDVKKLYASLTASDAFLYRDSTLVPQGSP